MVATLISQQDAETVARVFVAQVVFKYGTISTVQTDKRANFVSEVLKNTRKMKIKKIQSTAFHPGSLGSIRRSRRVSSALREGGPDELGRMGALCRLRI